ncbi:MAG: hypothetical protein EOO42_06790 [Flavobacteriales bacterium]|nr:MAG: hypothetical protein EOO42_06790 [Flavobacteriales bacterium]
MASTVAHAGTVTRYGCDVGTRIYIQKIGETTFWGTRHEVYSTGTSPTYSVRIYNNEDGKNITPCNEVAAGNYNIGGNACWVNSSVPPDNNNNSVTHQGGNRVSITYQECSVTQVPLDDHLWLIILGVGGISAYYLARNKYLAFN